MNLPHALSQGNFSMRGQLPIPPKTGGINHARDRKTVRTSTAQSPSSRIGHHMSQVDVAQAERYRRTPIGHVGKPLERNPSPRNLFEHVASDVSSSDFDFPIVGVLGGRAITIGPAMVSLEGANSGDPSGDPLGILGGSESKTGDPGVLYPKKPKESGGSCATSVPLYNIKK